MTPEARVKAGARHICEAAGAYWNPIVQCAMTKAGHPDVDVCFRGRFIAIECKAKKNRPTDLQLRRLREIRTAGGLALVVNEMTLPDLEYILEHDTDTDSQCLRRLMNWEVRDDE
jgi:hypothetical protein